MWFRPFHLGLWARCRRLWRPHSPLFWLMLVFNGLSSGMAWALHWAPPDAIWRWPLALLALSNAAAAAWLLWRLWAETPPP